jgi:hypothetical protein
MRAVRVRTGEYSGLPDRPVPWASVGGVVEAIAYVEPYLGGRNGDRGRSSAAYADAPE